MLYLYNNIKFGHQSLKCLQGIATSAWGQNLLKMEYSEQDDNFDIDRVKNVQM